MAGDRKRLQLDLSTEAAARLERIKELGKLANSTDAVRNALRLYEWFLEKTIVERHTVQVVKGDKVFHVEMLL